MAEVTPPSYLQNGAHSALSDRLTLSGLLQPGASGLASRGGVRASGDGLGMAVRAAATANNTVIVKAGTCFVPKSDGSGIYVCHNDADKTLTVPAASATQSRRDIVVAQVRDSTISGANDDWVLQVISGTPSSGTPVAPAVPGNALALADYLVPAGASTIVTSGNINDRRVTLTALGGVMPVLSTALPSNPFQGMTVWCTDTDEMRIATVGGASPTWRVQSFYPVPDPIRLVSSVAVQSATGPAGTWVVLPTRTFTSITLPKPAWVMLHLGAWMRAVTGTDVRATLAITGATTGPGTGGVLQDGSANWGDVLYSGVSDQTLQCSASAAMKFNAGTTFVEICGMRNNTTATPQVNYATARITPLRWA